MINKKIVTVSAMVVLLVVPLVGFAAIDLNVAQPPTAGAINLPGFMNAILGVVWKIFLAAAVVLLIIAGILFLTTQGDPEKVKKARLALIFAIIGIVVALLGFRMYSTICSLIMGDSNANTCSPVAAEVPLDPAAIRACCPTWPGGACNLTTIAACPDPGMWLQNTPACVPVNPC